MASAREEETEKLWRGVASSFGLEGPTADVFVTALDAIERLPQDDIDRVVRALAMFNNFTLRKRP